MQCLTDLFYKGRASVRGVEPPAKISSAVLLLPVLFPSAVTTANHIELLYFTGNTGDAIYFFNDSDQNKQGCSLIVCSVVVHCRNLQFLCARPKVSRTSHQGGKFFFLVSLDVF